MLDDTVVQRQNNTAIPNEALILNVTNAVKVKILL